jgi:hypothetical protein
MIVRRTAAGIVLGLIMSCSLSASQAAPAVSASDVKAAYLYQFGQYIESPARTSSLTVCVSGDDTVAAALERLTREDGASTKNLVRRDAAAALAAGTCGILFVGHDEPKGAALLKAAGGGPTLVVGEDAQFLRAGGMVAFVVQERKVRFSVNLANTDAAHVKLSSQLLKHAVEVIR